MDLIDMQSLSYDDHRYIMVYQDNMTNFFVLWPLKSKRATDVVMQILDIFLLFGAPNILQSDNGAEFTASIISQLKDLWPECKVVHGKPRHPQSQGSVDRANADIKI
jgi:transposase InsO family protein